VSEVVINGQVVVSGGDFAGRLPGRALAGPGTQVTGAGPVPTAG
jgi:hypothetical protein